MEKEQTLGWSMGVETSLRTTSNGALDLLQIDRFRTTHTH